MDVIYLLREQWPHRCNDIFGSEYIDEVVEKYLHHRNEEMRGILSIVRKSDQGEEEMKITQD